MTMRNILQIENMSTPGSRGIAKTSKPARIQAGGIMKPGPWEKHPTTGVERRALETELRVTRWEYRCTHCGQSFEPARANERFCSDACCNRAWTQKHRPTKRKRQTV